MYEDYDLDDFLFAAEMAHEWRKDRIMLEDEDIRDNHDPVEAYWFPPHQGNQRRERINAYLAREEGGCIG